jgi:hypothetical protein
MPAQSASCTQLPGTDCLFEIYEPQRVLAAVCPALTFRVVDRQISSLCVLVTCLAIWMHSCKCCCKHQNRTNTTFKRKRAWPGISLVVAFGLTGYAVATVSVNFGEWVLSYANLALCVA